MVHKSFDQGTAGSKRLDGEDSPMDLTLLWSNRQPISKKISDHDNFYAPMPLHGMGLSMA